MKIVYKIRHIETGKFVRIRLTKIGVDVWAEKNVISCNCPGYGNVLYKTHKGWSTPPEPTNEDFGKIGCEIVKYEITENEL